MTRFAPALTALMLAAMVAPVAAPVAAQSMDVLLPALSWPADDVTTSTKGCVPVDGKPVCALEE